ncbi:hypothetical protein OX284_007375 [Flavobacterium sp. SUN046]|uniref:hypothetical protein n=1 Tax=Flavobacterium sp. SUN046 TaxID=3002440 RepID=UPI002DB5B902|nr:hypothetical protein [Flavobacterium sp. SUN046]MEC4049246.1 hypothetical protein [Flavobacterium sp. SUN046]
MRRWIYLINPFAVIGKMSFAKGIKISTYHLAQLELNKTLPFFGGIYIIYKVLHDDFDLAYNLWRVQVGYQKGSTLSKNELLRNLVDVKFGEWEYVIAGVFKPNTPNYIMLFPRGKSIFVRGSIESRINAVGQLGIALGGFETLSEVKADVDDFFGQLTNVREDQLGKKGSKGVKSDDVEHKMAAVTTQMYANLGLLMNHYKDDPKLIESFFDMTTIRRHEQTVFRKTVKKHRDYVVVERTFDEGDYVKLKNDGDVSLSFALVAQANDPITLGTSVVVNAEDEKLISIKSLGDLSNRFLKVQNTTEFSGHCVLEFQ